MGRMLDFVHVTDLHLDHYAENLDAMTALVRRLPADVILIGGDNGGDTGISAIVDRLAELHPKAAVAWIMGNHDLWGQPYTHLWDVLPGLSATYLEIGNLELSTCTVVGTYGHYDYSGRSSELSCEQLETFTDGRHIWNDRFIDRKSRTNPQIAGEIAERFRGRYRSAEARRLPIVVVSHTWPFAPTDVALRGFLSAYSCNQQIGNIFMSATRRPAVVFCGHTHRAREWNEFGFPMINTGSDYRDVRVTHWILADSQTA